MDFMELPEKVLVIVDRLSRGVILAPVKNLSVKTMAVAFIRGVVAYHGLPDSIISDRGSQFVSRFWKAFCIESGIETKLSTAYHQQTDGLSERTIQSVKDYLQKMSNSPYKNIDIKIQLAMAQIAQNSRISSSTRFSPFFLTHGSEARLTISKPIKADSWQPEPARAGREMVDHLKKAWDIAQATLAASQEAQESATNRHRQPAPNYRVGDQVWLSLENQHSTTTKLPRQAKYKITEVVGPLNYRLNVPPGIHNVFHTNLLRPASTDPFPSQKTDDWQPPPTYIENEKEYEVESILDEKRRGNRGWQVLVKWVGYSHPTWEPRQELQETNAYRKWQQNNP